MKHLKNFKRLQFVANLITMAFILSCCCSDDKEEEKDDAFIGYIFYNDGISEGTGKEAL